MCGGGRKYFFFLVFGYYSHLVTLLISQFGRIHKLVHSKHPRFVSLLTS